MNYIALPSGTIINLEQVAFISAPCLAVAEEEVSPEVIVAFSATFPPDQRQGGTLRLALTGDDAKSFLAQLASKGIPTGERK
jgi:hypothetical protein